MPPKRAAKASPQAPTRTQPRRGASEVKAANKPDPGQDKPTRKQTGRKRKTAVDPEDEDDKPASEPEAKKAKVAAARKPAAKKSQNPPTERDENERCYWLMKAEPESRLEKGVDVKFAIDDLEAADEPEAWDGVRNPVAQKNMRNMRKGELAFFYHSNCKIPGIAGVMKIVREQSVDEAAFMPKHPYFDPKSDPKKPRWIQVHVEFVKKFDEFVPLKRLQEHAKADGPLQTLQTLKLSRLSVSQVKLEEWKFIMGLAGEDWAEIEKLGLAGKW